MTTDDSNIFAPPLDWKDGAMYELLCFALHSQTQHCTGCGALEKGSVVYRVFGEKRNNAMRRLAKASRIPKGSPIIVISLPDREIPICSNCVVERSGPEGFAIRSEAQWQAALVASQRAREAKREEPRSARPSAARVNLGSVL